MRPREYGLLFAAGLLVVGLVAAFLPVPGYMDAEYYFATGQRLAAGQGFSEPFLWNYLDNPQGLPHPSHAYWLPLTSLFAAAGMKLGGSLTFHAAQIGFVLVAALLPPLTAALANALTRSVSSARLAGILSIFSFFYLPFLPTTDTFALYMFLGGGLLLLLTVNRLKKTGSSPNKNFVEPSIAAPENQPRRHKHIKNDFTPLVSWCLRGEKYIWIRSVTFGLISALMYLSRADGLLWLLIALLALNLTLKVRRVRYSLALLAGFSLLALPWMLRNYSIWGTPFSPGGSAALWFTNYDQLFIFPASQVSFAHWLQSGLVAIVKARLWALGQNLQTALAVQAEIFLAPLILLGAWRLRHQPTVQVGLLAWVLTLAAMTLVFPFAGARGGFFHSGAAVQTLFWALAAAGLDVFLEWGVRVRHWSPQVSRSVFFSAILGFAALLSVYSVGGRVLGLGYKNQPWGAGQTAYIQLQDQFQRLEIPIETVILVNNPPGFYLASQRPAIVIPDGNVDTLLSVAERFGAQIVLVEANHPHGLDALYDNPIAYSQFELLWSDGINHILRIADE